MAGLELKLITTDYSPPSGRVIHNQISSYKLLPTDVNFMITARYKVIFSALFASEIISLILAYIASGALAFGSPLNGVSHQITFFLTPILLLNILAILVNFSLKMSSLENKIKAESRIFLLRTVVILLTTALVFISWATLGQATDTVYIILAFTALSLLLMMLSNYLVIAYLARRYRADVNKIKVLLVGMNKRVKFFIDNFSDSQLLGLDLIGYVDTEKNPDSQIDYIGKIEDVESILQREVVDEIFIFLPIRSFYDEIFKIIKLSDFYGITASTPSRIFDTDESGPAAGSLSTLSTAYYGSVRRRTATVALGVKRIVDVVASFVVLMIVWPIMLAVAAYIKKVSPGPAFFVQRRTGYNKRIFKMYKFRTMIPDAEKMYDSLLHLNEMDGAAFKITRDPRLIPGGHFLRRFSLDELPQLFNVLMGDMSLVGPRPLSLDDYHRMRSDWQRKRFSAKPGLTCIWQVSGRNELSFDEWMTMDIKYIDNWSLGLDCILILKTIVEVFRGRGR